MADPRPAALSSDERIRRALTLVRRCRRALVRANNEDELLQAVCDAAVSDGGYRFAWVGLAEQDGLQRVFPIALAGHHDGYLESVDIRWADVAEGHGPTGTAIRERRPYWTRSIATDPAMQPWRDAALRRGYLSSLAIPMFTDDGVFGALTVYAAVPDAFDADEVLMLSELAEDLAFGIRTLRTRTAHRTMALVVDQIPTVVVITDLQGNIEYVNPRFTELTGYTLDEVKGRNPRILKSGVTSEDEYERLWRTITSGGRWTGEFHQKRKDGSVYLERAIILPMHDASGPIGKYLKVAEDISERTELEGQLRQAQKMEAVGRLAGGIAHDFNNLLTAIQGFTEFAMQDLPHGSPLRSDLMEVLAASDRAAHLTRQLLAFGRRGSDRPDFVDVAAVSQQAEAMLRRLIGEHITLNVDIANTVCMAVLEPGQVEQILVNLAVNGRDAMPQGGTLSISVGPVTIDEEFAARHLPLVPGRYVRIEVRDTGVGMDEATRARVFEPFFTTKPIGHGTGLGLSTVYAITRQCRGAIDVVSAPGAGTTFRIWLPVVNDHADVVNAPLEAPAIVGNADTILVVDDDAALCQFTSRVLRQAGFTVLSATSPGEALLTAEQHKGAVDLLLTDVVMPQIRGPELARRLGATRPGLRVGYMTGYADDEALPDGVDGVLLQKPFTRDALLANVRRLLRRAHAT
ncbi:MAG: GAF domain-containing protein [Vicinamibacterales bacterium]